MEYTYNVATSATSVPVWFAGGGGSGAAGGGGCGVGYGGSVTYALQLGTPRPQTALEWLDGEIEAVCKMARQAS